MDELVAVADSLAEQHGQRHPTVPRRYQIGHERRDLLRVELFSAATAGKRTSRPPLRGRPGPSCRSSPPARRPPLELGPSPCSAR